MSLLQDLLSLRAPVKENYHVDPEDALAARADDLHASDALTFEIAAADEFSVEHDSEDMIHVLDGERTIRLSMPYSSWIELCSETLRSRGA